MLRSATAQTLPPRPPSPPEGPPRGTNFSRRNAALPSPPLPAWTWILASSMNFINEKAPPTPAGLFAESGESLSRDHAHGFLVVGALDPVLDLARYARVQGVVAAHADVDAGVHDRAALAHQDLAGAGALAAVGLDAEPLRVGVAPVTRAAACFLVCHVLSAFLPRRRRSRRCALR